MAAATLPSSGRPSNAKRARARIGAASFTKLFQMPVTTTETVLLAFENPQLVNMA